MPENNEDQSDCIYRCILCKSLHKRIPENREVGDFSPGKFKVELELVNSS